MLLKILELYSFVTIYCMGDINIITMLSNLVLYNFQSGHKPSLGENENRTFVMATCQRTMVMSYGFDPFENEAPEQKHSYLEGEDAYMFLLETICGLQSKLLGENEIVSQFKEAFKNYLALPEREGKLIKVIEKLLKDAKEIRTKYLIGISQKTYASITRKFMMQRFGAEHILILGSGNLAEDLINQFKKKSKVSIAARNKDKVKKLAEEHGIDIVPWNEPEFFKEFSHIANTIGAETILFNDNFFQDWKERHPQGGFIDLGAPSTIDTTLHNEDGVIRLNDIFEEGAIHEKYKKEKIEMARQAMKNIVAKRAQYLRKSLFSDLREGVQIA
jgi:glutamyl-tRNA reductase